MAGVYGTVKISVFAPPGGYLTIRGGSAPSSNLLPFHIPFCQKRYPFYVPFIEKRYLFHIPTSEHCTPFLRFCNKVNEQYYGRISNVTRGNVKQTTSVIYQFTALLNTSVTDFTTLLYSSICIYLEPEKGTHRPSIIGSSPTPHPPTPTWGLCCLLLD